MPTARQSAVERRNRNFDATHEEIIAASVRLISEKGVDSLSMAAIARATGINRTTLYYHFADRDALLAAVKTWSARQLAAGFAPDLPQQARIRHINRFVLENAELLKLFIEDFLAPGDIRDRYPKWDALVEGIDAVMRAHEAETVDAEIYCTILLTAAFIAPRVYKNSVRPELDIATIAERFLREQTRMLRHDALLKI